MADLEVLHPRCCGLDIHKKTVVACVLRPGDTGGRPHKEVQTFGTMTADLEDLARWLAAEGVTHVALESTGVYWKPIWNVLDEGRGLTLLLVNAQHVKAVPGRKTDVRDCEWLATLLRHGLVRASFVPERPQRELRELTRLRTTRVRARSAEINRLHKTLEGANIKLAAVASDLLGVSAREILAKLVAGTTDPVALAELARGKLRTKLPALERALAGRFAAHQQFLVAEHLAVIDELEAAIARLSAELARRLPPGDDPSPGPAVVVAATGEVVVAATGELIAAPPAEEAPISAEDLVGGRAPAPVADDPVARLDTIPGVGRLTAEALVAEIGTDMSRFPSAAHLASWAGLCPGQRQSGGKHGSGKTRKGPPWLKALLVEAAVAAARTKDTYLAAQYHRLAARRGKKKAVVAVAHSILVIAYHLLRDGTTYQDLGGNYFDEQDQTTVERRLVKRLEQLGHKVTLEPAA